MKRFLIALMAAGSLAACSTAQNNSTATVYKAEIAAEAAFNAAATAEHDAKASGILTGAKAAQADGLVTQAYAALKVARASADAGTDPDITNLVNLVNEITTLSGGKS